MSIKNIYESGRTVRYHTNHNFIDYKQTVADHTWGCLALLMYLHPKPSLNLIGAVVYHDSGEKWAGDLAHPFKQANPVIAKKHKETENQLAKDMLIPQYDLTDKEKLWLELVDKYEAVLFCKLKRPDLYITNDWQNQRKYCESIALKLDILDKLLETPYGKNKQAA